VDILALARQFEQRVEVLGEGAHALVACDRLLQPLPVLHDFLAFFRLAPEIRSGDLLFESS